MNVSAEFLEECNRFFRTKVVSRCAGIPNLVVGDEKFLKLMQPVIGRMTFKKNEGSLMDGNENLLDKENARFRLYQLDFLLDATKSPEEVAIWIVDEYLGPSVGGVLASADALTTNHLVYFQEISPVPGADHFSLIIWDFVRDAYPRAPVESMTEAAAMLMVEEFFK